jgi:hypothetical protein
LQDVDAAVLAYIVKMVLEDPKQDEDELFDLCVELLIRFVVQA